MNVDVLKSENVTNGSQRVLSGVVTLRGFEKRHSNGGKSGDCGDRFVIK